MERTPQTNGLWMMREGDARAALRRFGMSIVKGGNQCLFR